MTPRRRLTIAAMCLGFAGGPAGAAGDDGSPAIRALLAAGATPLARGSGCSGRLPGVKRASLGALVANRLGYLDGGTNRVRSHCTTRGRCEVAITHADGEDIGSAVFRFRLSAGKLAPASLQCLLTP